MVMVRYGYGYGYGHELLEFHDFFRRNAKKSLTLQGQGRDKGLQQLLAAQKDGSLPDPKSVSNRTTQKQSPKVDPSTNASDR